MAPSHHVGKFLPKTKGFVPHDFTLIASVMGESVICNLGTVIAMVLAGKISPLWHVSLRPDAGVSDDELVCHHLILLPHNE